MVDFTNTLYTQFCKAKHNRLTSVDIRTSESILLVSLSISARIRGSRYVGHAIIFSLIRSLIMYYYLPSSHWKAGIPHTHLEHLLQIAVTQRISSHHVNHNYVTWYDMSRQRSTFSQSCASHDRFTPCEGPISFLDLDGEHTTFHILHTDNTKNQSFGAA